MFLIFVFFQTKIAILGQETCDLNDVSENSTWLFMYNCEMEEIGYQLEAFDNLKELKLLDNNIIHIRENNFDNLSKLKVLGLIDNQIQFIEMKSFEKLNALKILDMSYNNIETIDGLFRENENLTYLYLRSNLIKSIHRDTFSKLIYLTTIHIDNNLIEFLDEDLFRNNKNIKWISLSDNYLQQIQDNTFKNLMNITNIELAYNNLTELTPSIFKNNRKLKNLSLTGNLFDSITKSIFELLPELENVYLNNNQLKELKDSELFCYNPNLLTLKLNNNHLTILPVDIFKPLRNLSEINLSAMRIQKISDNLFRWNSKLEKILLNSNNISVINEQSFEALHMLEQLYLHENQITHISTYVFRKNVRLSLLNLSKNRIRSLAEDSLDCNAELEELLLNDNEIDDLPETIFHWTVQLKQINLANNKLTSFGEQTFSTLALLTHLQLQNNQLRILSVQLLMANENLEIFNCSHNQLRFINNYLHYKKPNLKEVDLSQNPILKMFSQKYLNNIANTRYHIWDSAMDGFSIRNTQTLKRIHMTIPSLHVRQYDLVLTIVHCKVRRITCHDQPITAVLDVSHNYLTTIECVTNMTKLNILNLSHNHIQTLSASWFEHHTLLKQLDLSHNGMRIHLRHFEASKQLMTLSISNNTIDWSWSLYLIPRLFPKLKKIFMHDINVYCPLLDTILYNFTEWNLTVVGYNAALTAAELSVGGIPCVNYRFLKYVLLDVSFGVVICIIVLLSIIHNKNDYIALDTIYN